MSFGDDDMRAEIEAEERRARRLPKTCIRCAESSAPVLACSKCGHEKCEHLLRYTNPVVVCLACCRAPNKETAR